MWRNPTPLNVLQPEQLIKNGLIGLARKLNGPAYHTKSGKLRKNEKLRLEYERGISQLRTMGREMGFDYDDKLGRLVHPGRQRKQFRRDGTNGFRMVQVRVGISTVRHDYSLTADLWDLSPGEKQVFEGLSQNGHLPYLVLKEPGNPNKLKPGEIAKAQKDLQDGRKSPDTYRLLNAFHEMHFDMMEADCDIELCNGQGGKLRYQTYDIPLAALLQKSEELPPVQPTVRLQENDVVPIWGIAGNQAGYSAPAPF